jgi:WD40 repeat protein
VVATLTGHQGGVWSVAWRPDNARLATASTDGVVRIFFTDFQEVLDLARANVQRDFTSVERTKFLNK